MRSGRIVLAAFSCAVAALTLSPAVYLVVRASEAGRDTIDSYLLRPRTAELLWNTVSLATAVTALSVIVGVGLAWCLTSGVARSRPLMVALLTAPLAIPSYVSGFVWVRTLPDFYGFPAAVLVLTLACYPLVMLPTVAALSGIGRSAEDAARTLGCGAARAFLRVTLPRIRLPVAAGALLVALYAISDFGGPAIVRFEPFTVGIYNAYNGSFNRTVAAVYGCVLAIMALALAAGERFIRRDAEPSANAERTRGIRDHAGAWAFAIGMIGVGLAFPIAGLIGQILRSQRADTALDDVLPAIGATLSLAVQATLVITLLAIPVAFYTARPRTRLSGFVDTATNLGYALPGVTVALSMVFIGLRVVPDWYQTTALLLIAYAVLFLPVSIGPLRSAIDAMPDAVSEVSRTLGAGSMATLLRVVLPMIAPGMLAGAALTCVSVAKELPATLMLAPVGTRTLAVDMWSLNNDLAYGRAAVLGLILIAVTSIPTVVLSTLFSRRGPST